MKNIKKDFGQKTVLHDINCSIEKGEIFGLLGPSGAGKTTIIKILTGQIPKTSGEAALYGVNTDKLTEEVYSKIGMVLDIQGLYTRLTCYDNLAIFAEIYKINKKRIYEVLEKVKLADEAKKIVSKLSKGMAQRLVIARAILHYPKILFLDEPTSGLDPATSLEIHKIIFELRETGSTIFLTTHNMEEASVLCDNVALLNEGNIVEYGHPDAICRKYNDVNSIKILLKNGEKITLPNNNYSSEQIAAYFRENNVEAIHSTEPNLETVFISLTGRELV
ncbi:MAG: ABC transporter ATP-binding protein [Treponema sp.]|nr:ABC transporter ATP-binding protein [Treponema sp.]